MAVGLGSGAYLAFVGMLFVSGNPVFKDRQSLLADIVSNSFTNASIPDMGVRYAFFPEADTSAKEGDGQLTLVFAGDIMLARQIGNIMEEKNDWQHPFYYVRNIIADADIAFANLESVIATTGTSVGSIYSFRADPRSLKGLSYAGFDVLSVANNHAWDYGPDALKESLLFLKSSGIDYVGGGFDYEEAHNPVIKEIDGTKIAYIGYTNLIPRGVTTQSSKPALAYLDLEQTLLDIDHIQKEADIVIVSLHWGEEYQTHSNELQQRIGRALINAGANIIIGHHPHVPQEVERYNGGYIAYSVGNLIFDQNFGEGTERGLVVRAIVEGDRVSALEEIPVQFNLSFQPFVAE